MRKVIFGGANSLDNYLARPDHAVDWLLWGDEAAAVMAEWRVNSPRGCATRPAGADRHGSEEKRK